jgi:nitrogen fixation protein
MANKRITELTDIGTPDANDVLEIVDVSDTTDSPEGSSKKVKISELGGGGSQNLSEVLAIGGREVKGVGEIYTFVEEDKTKILVDALGEESYVLNANIFVDGDSIIIDRTARATEIPLTLASEVIIDNSSIFESINLQPNAVAIITRIGGNDGVSEIFSLTYQTSRISNRLTKVINDVSPYTIIVDDINKLLVIESEEDIVINDDIVELNNEFHLKNISGSARELLYDGTINFEGNSIIENQGYCILKCIDTTTNTWSVNTIVGDFVPYNGATQDVDLGENGLKAGQLTLDITPTGTASIATTRWNDTIGSSETTLKGGNVILKNGVDLVARVVNKVTPNTTLTKASYQVVRISGAQGQRLAVNLAQANNDNNSADTLGIVTETIATNQEGFIMTVGQLENINTTGSLQGETWSDGDVLYLSPTTAGRITNVKPIAPSHIVIVGYVEYAHANNGKIYVKVMNGWELDELHNVAISTPLNNQALTYETSTDLWKNKTIIEDSITNGVTTIAPSQNAVFDALNLKIDKPQTLRATSNITLTATTSSQKLFGNLGANGDGSFNVEVGRYKMDMIITLTNLAGSGSIGFITGLGDGTSAFANVTMGVLGWKGLLGGTNPPLMSRMVSFTTAPVVSGTGTSTNGFVQVSGEFSVTTAGKFFPGISLNVSATPDNNTGSFCTITKID